MLIFSLRACWPSTKGMTVSDEFPADFDSIPDSKKIAFSGSEIVPCPKCSRPNPPTRAVCIYCGVELPFESISASVKLKYRKPEIWEQGQNVVITRHGTAAFNAEKIAADFSLEPDDIGVILGGSSPLPIVRVGAKSEAEAITKRLAAEGFETRIVADEELASDKPPIRIRSLRFAGDVLITVNFNTGKETSIEKSELKLIVKGVRIESKTESVRKIKRRGEGDMLDESQSWADELIVDLYCRGDMQGFRIIPHAFDFSVLGDRKTLLTAQNLNRLLEDIIGFSPDVKIDSSYSMSKRMLDKIWEVDERTDRIGTRRIGLAKGSVARRASDNIGQFTRYSRLQNYLL